MSSHLRFITAASLIVFGGMIGVGAVALLPTAADRTVLANAATSDLPATPCKQSWLPFDRSCLTKRDLPWTGGRGTANGATSEVPAEAENATKPPVTEGQRVAVAPQTGPSRLPVFQPAAASAQPSTFQPVPQASTPEVSMPQAPQAPAPQASAPQASAPQPVAPQASTPSASPRPAVAALPQEQSPQPSTPPRVQRNNIATPVAKPPAQRPAAKERLAAKSAVDDNEEETRPAKK